jgi:Protein of unknown function (DUF5818)
MKKLLLSTATLLLASGLAIGQDPQPQSTPSGQAQTDVGGQTDKDQQLFKGCLDGTKDNYTLTAEDGKTYRLHSDKDINEHVGHQVELRGTIKAEGADRPDDVSAGAAGGQEIDVADVKMISESCAGSASASQPATSSDASSMSAEQSTTPAPEAQSQSTETQPSAAASSTPDAASQPAPATEQQPATSTEQPATSTESSAMTSTQSTEPAPSAATTTPEPAPSQAVESDTAAAAADVNAQQDQQAAEQATQPVDQSATAADQDAAAGAADEQALPQTASPLPLLGLLGFGSLAAAWVSRRK